MRFDMHMENNNDGHTHGEGENLCMMCRMNERMHGRGCGHCHGMHHFMLLRIVILLALLGFVFWAGVCIGSLENRGEFGAHHRAMMSGYGYDDGPMMQNAGYRVYNVRTDSATAIPATVAAPAQTN